MTARFRLSILATIAIVALAVIATTLLPRFSAPPTRRLETESRAPGMSLPRLDVAAGWLNGGPLGPDSLAGRPIVLVVWSDTDPRSPGLLAEAQTWHAAYARYGVRVVGLHVPDYSFASDPAVPARLSRHMGLRFPIALDPGYRIRSQLGRAANRPAVLVADTTGRVVISVSSERRLEADRAIREQVRRRHPEMEFPSEGQTVWGLGSTDEPRFVFLGTSRAPRGPLSAATPGRTQVFTAQFRFQEEGEPYTPYPVGRWTPAAEGLTAARGGAATFVAVRYDGGRASAVMSPPPSGASRVWILADDRWLDEEARDADVAVDSRGASYVEVAEPRLYRIARGAPGRVLKLSPEDPGVTVYSFAFEPAAPDPRPSAVGSSAGSDSETPSETPAGARR